MLAAQALRERLLEAVCVLVAGAPEGCPGGALGAAVCDACAGLGAAVSTCRTDGTDEATLDAAVAAVVGEAGRIDLLAVDGAGLFAHALARGGDGHAALRACMDGAWNATRAVVNHAFLAPVAPAQGAAARAAGRSGEASAPSAPARRIVYLAPPPGAGRSEIGGHARAACAGLENLARTLSVEWARHGITTVTIAPGAQSPAGEAAALAAYLASPAGAYFSGCLLDLRGP